MSLTDDGLIALLRDPDDAPADPRPAFRVGLYEQLAGQAGYRVGGGTSVRARPALRVLILLGLLLLAASIAAVSIGQRLTHRSPSDLAASSRALYTDPPAFRMHAGEFTVSTDGHGTWRVEGGDVGPGGAPAGNYTVWKAGVGGGTWDEHSQSWQPISGEVAPIPLSSELFWGTATNPATGTTERTPGSLTCAGWEWLGDDVVAGRSATRIRCTDRDLDLWLDSATLLMLRIKAGDHTPDWEPGAGMTVTSIELPQVVDPEMFALKAPPEALPDGTPTRLKVGSPLPTWSGTTLDGETVASDGTLGRPLVLMIWAAWCQPCIDQLPVLSGLSARDDVKLVTMGFSSDAVAVHAALPSAGVPFPVVVDQDGSIGEQFGVTAVPLVVFVDGRGIVRGFETGLLTAEELGHATDDLVAGRPIGLPLTP